MATISDYYLEDAEDYIAGVKVPSIVEDYVPIHPSPVDRYFTKYYKPKSVDNQEEDHLVLFHTNKICLIGLVPNHIALKKGITSINYDIGNMDRSQNQVKGKGKKGGMNLQPNSALAIITCADGSTYKVESCITAKLLEMNERVVQKPELLGTEGEGYIAVVLPKLQQCESIKSKLLTQEQYNEYSKGKFSIYFVE